ncbi:MAG: ABC transporter permease [Clostridiales bacterium]|jgi:ribose transport system permease protein|nr:ABC transporter permease [Clostridiales bacterium]
MMAEKKDDIKLLLKNNIVVMFLFLIIVVLSIASPYFLNLGNLMDVAKQASINGIIALGMTFVITTGGIDLSVGPVWALSGVVAALLMNEGFSWPLAGLFGILVGACCGLSTGLLVTKGKMQPFIATLATMNVYRGIALILTGGYTVYNLPATFRVIGGGMLFNIIPMPVIVFGIIFLISWFIFSKQIKGRHLTAIGNNKEAARLSGIGVEKTICWAYVYSAVMCAIGGGIVATARLGAAEPTIGSGAELDAIAAVVIGGTSMSGGESRISGTLVGAVLISAMNNGLTLLNVPTYYKIVVVGLILIAAMLLDSFGKAKRK